MAEVKWSARRTSDSVLVDITGDTETATADTAPTPNELDVGGVQTIRKIGPFHVAHDAAGITANGAVLTTELVAGAVILNAWAFVTEEWNFAEQTNVQIDVAPNSDPGNVWNVTKYATPGTPFDWAVQGDATVSIEATSGTGSAVPFRNVVQVVEASRLVLQTFVVASTGEADIYAIIAEPAS